MTQREPSRRLPLPSEDTGDLAETPASGQTDDYLVAREEGVPYDPPNERVGDTGVEQGGPDDAVLDRAIDALRRSELPAGNRIRLAARGRVVHVSGEIESIDILDEILALLGDVEGVEHVVDETTIGGG